jgi:hypothetical protein
MTENPLIENSSSRRKRKDALVILIAWALLSGIADVLWYYSQWALFLSFVVHLGVQMGVTSSWCDNDARMRCFVMPSGMHGFIVTAAIIGVPWYFIRTRGWIGAAKLGFGLPLLLLSSTFYFGAWSGARSMAALLGYFG